MLYHTQALQLLAIDVETANRQDGRICQVGIAQLQGSSVSVVLDELVDPKGNFLKEFTEQYHGITKEMVRGRGEFDSLHPRLHELLANRFVFSWHDFDSKQLHAACHRYELPPLSVIWLDACRAARHLWPHLREYKLNVVARHFGVTFRHHNAAADAFACMEIMRRALEEFPFAEVFNAAFYRPHDSTPPSQSTGSSFLTEVGARSKPQWIERQAEDIERPGDPNGRHYGNLVVFSGDFSVPREDLADLAHAAGFAVKNSRANVCRRTHYLLRGENAGMTKLNRAQELIAAGQNIVVVTEEQFRRLLK